MNKIIGWFSGGVSSAIAIKIALESIKVDEIIYIHIDNHHSDTLRFLVDCEKWYGRKIIKLQSKLASVQNAILLAGGRGYINGAAGASCTHRLKRLVRKDWESKQSKQLTYIWGMDYSEKHRVNRLQEAMENQKHLFPLVQNNIDKNKAHQILKASKISRPKMYDLGYNNNNCVGCVKGGMGYWNKIRQDFPDVFKRMALIERRVGASCIKNIFLDTLNPERGRMSKPIIEDCGIFCETISIK